MGKLVDIYKRQTLQNYPNSIRENQRGMTLPESSFITNPFTFLMGP